MTHASDAPRVCVVGSTNVDLVSYVERLPHLGETLHGQRFRLAYGGKGANQAIMAARLGAAVTMVSRVGRDAFGEGALANFRHNGVATEYVLLDETTSTGVAPIAVDAAGNNAIIVIAGANERVAPADVLAAAPAIRAAGALVCQLEVPIEATLAALRLGREAGVPTIFNPAPARTDLPGELLGLCDVFCPNEGETALLTGMAVTTLPEAEAAAGLLLHRGPRAVVLTLGERGALLATAAGTAHLPAPSVTPVDTTGAGDAFVGSLAFFLAGGLELHDAVGRAVQIAAVSVQTAGAQASYPHREQLPAALLALH